MNNDFYAYCLNKIRNSSRKDYWYEKALKRKMLEKELYPDKAEEIETDWQKNWSRKFKKALV